MARQIEFEPQPFPVGTAQRCDRQLARIVVRIDCLLRPVAIDHLAKIPLAVEQSDRNERQAQVAGRLELIASDVTKTARVDWQRFAQHEFHAEVCDAGQRRSRMGSLEPRGRRRRIPSGTHKVLDAFAEHGVGRQVLDAILRDRLKHRPWIVREIPQYRIEPPPHFVRGVVPGPLHVQRKLGERIEPLDVSRHHAMHWIGRMLRFAHSAAACVCASLPILLGCSTLDPASSSSEHHRIRLPPIA